MTTKADFIKILKKRLANNQDPTLDEDIVAEMDFVQRNILERLPFDPHFLVSEEYRTDTVAGERRVPVQDKFLKEVYGAAMWIYEGDAVLDEDKWTKLKKGNIGTLRDRYPGSGKPLSYDLQGDYYLLFPTPDAAYDLRIYIYQQEALPSAMDDTAENEWLIHATDLFLGEVGFIIAGQYLQSDRMAARFAQQANMARQRLHYYETDREQSGDDVFMGEG